MSQQFIIVKTWDSKFTVRDWLNSRDIATFKLRRQAQAKVDALVAANQATVAT